ncbi:MAG: hypothetical protein JEY79_17350 [Pseudodesulfovibrio sp.]|nr:hypothetical protein [Pseudodesulfovibrio sp.]
MAKFGKETTDKAAETAAVKPRKKKVDLGPMKRVQFMNNETRGVDITFNYEGQHFGPLEDGKEYDLPEKVVKHLNSLAIPRMEYRLDPATGQQKSVSVGMFHRFSCHPVTD